MAGLNGRLKKLEAEEAALQEQEGPWATGPDPSDEAFWQQRWPAFAFERADDAKTALQGLLPTEDEMATVWEDLGSWFGRLFVQFAACFLHQSDLRPGDENGLTRLPGVLARLVAMTPVDLRVPLVAALGTASRSERGVDFYPLHTWLEAVAYRWSTLPDLTEDTVRLLLDDYLKRAPHELGWLFQACARCGLRSPTRAHPGTRVARCPHCGGTEFDYEGQLKWLANDQLYRWTR
jgi:hypothetical protein